MKRLSILVVALLLLPSLALAEGVLTPAANPPTSVNYAASVWDDGARGDGVTDDTAAIRRTIARAGIGGTIILSPGKTYLVSDSLTSLTSQTIQGRGATLKRAPQVTTTTTASIATAGATTVTVTNAAVFSAGDTISFSVEDHAAATITNHYSMPVAIQSIDTATNTLTLQNALVIGGASTGDLEAVLAGANAETSYTFGSGAIVAKVYTVLTATSGTVVTGLTINGWWKDGSGTIQQPVAHWDLFAEIQVHESGGNTHDVTLTNVTVNNFAAEAIEELNGSANVTAVFTHQEATSTRYTNVTITNGAGNGIHTSGIHNSLISGFYCRNINQYLGVGHIGGCVTMSWTGQHLVVRDSYMDTAYAGLSNAEIKNHSNIVFTGNLVKNMFRAGFEANGRSNNAVYGPSSILVTDNHFINCRYLIFRSNAASGTGLLDGVIISGNTLSGTQLQLEYAPRIMFRNNIVRNDAFSASNVSASRAYTDTTAVVASGTNYYIGQKVFLAKSGSPIARSRDLAVSNVSGTTITFSGPIGVSAADNIPAGSYLYDADRMPVIEVASGTVTTGDFTVTVPDASLFVVNQWMAVSSTSSASATTPAHIKSIDYVGNVITLGTSLNRTFTAVNLQFWPVGFSVQTNTPLTIQATAVTFSDNIIVGGNGGLFFSGDCTGSVVSGNMFQRQRSYGLTTSDTATSAESIRDNNITAFVGVSASGWYGVRITSAANVIGNIITTTSAGHKGIWANAGTKPVITANVISGSATAPLDITSLVTTPLLGTNYLLGTAAISDASTSPTYGTATVTAAATTVVVTHNLGYAPLVKDIIITPTLLSLSKSWWLSTITSTQFTINVDVVPGAGTATFAWSIRQ